MNTPHVHPRATEINFSLNTTLRGGVLIENGARFAELDIRLATATIFPQGAIHFEMNPSCEPAMFVAGKSFPILFSGDSVSDALVQASTARTRVCSRSPSASSVFPRTSSAPP